MSRYHPTLSDEEEARIRAWVRGVLATGPAMTPERAAHIAHLLRPATRARLKRLNESAREVPSSPST